MRASRSVSALVLSCAVLSGFSPSTVEAGEKCTSAIGKLPVVITKPGVFCMKKNLATAATNITAIDIQANNVTIDCNGFALDGSAAGPTTNTIAIAANGKQSNVTVRNCVMRGFFAGVYVNSNDPGTQHLIEDNRLEAMTALGIYVLGYGSVVRRNVVLNMVARAQTGRSTGITVLGDAIDNVVDGVRAAADAVDFSAEGIYAGGVGGLSGVGFLVQGNRVHNLVPKGMGFARGITTAASGVSIRGNSVVQASLTSGQGFFCSLGGFARDNDVVNYTQPQSSCSDVNGSNLGF